MDARHKRSVPDRHRANYWITPSSSTIDPRRAAIPCTRLHPGHWLEPLAGNSISFQMLLANLAYGTSGASLRLAADRRLR
jgi:hypothetical protein